MTKTSINLSDKLFFTLVWTDGTAYIGKLDGEQKKLVEFTKEELQKLTEFLRDMSYDILGE